MPTTIEDKEFWERQLEKLKASGLSRRQYCRETEIDYHRFSYWIKQLSITSSTFIPVELQKTSQAPDKITLCTMELHGHVLKIHDLSALSFLLERLA